MSRRNDVNSLKILQCTLLLVVVLVTKVHGLSQPTKISTALGRSICSQQVAFASTGILQPHKSYRPQAPEGAKCGWYIWGGKKCGKGQRGRCKFQKFENCRRGEKLNPEDDRIVGGRDARPHSYPSIVTLDRNGKVHCAGSILTPSWILTAAHCVSGFDIKQLSITAAQHDKRTKEGEEQTIKVKKAVIHEDYTLGGKNANDITVLELVSPLSFNDKVAPIALPAGGYLATGMTTTIGWGVTTEGGRPSDVLQEVELPIISDDECKKLYAQYEMIPSHLCTLVNGKDGCQGDSGGPLLEINNGNQVIVGVTSWGRGCARPQDPGVWTEVSYYIDWIKKNVGPELKL